MELKYNNAFFAISVILALSFLVNAELKLGGIKPPRPIPPTNQNGTATLPKGEIRRVLIIGGGVAGLSAALELAERGYQVTIKEARDVVGGGLAARSVKILNQAFNVENRFHSWFENFYQMNDIIKRLNTSSLIKTWSDVSYIYKNYKMENFKNDGSYPLNFLRLIKNSKNLKFIDLLEGRSGIKDAIEFDYDKVYITHDSMTFDEWAKNSFSKDPRFSDVLFRPLVNEMNNNASTVSAAEVLKIIHLTLISNYIDKRQISSVNYGKVFVEPLVKKLQALKVKIMTNTPVKSLLVNDDDDAVIGDEANQKDIYNQVILATDSDSADEILKNTINDYSGEPLVYNSFIKLRSNTKHLRKSAPYKVIRVWLKKGLDASHPKVAYTPEHAPLMLIAQYHQIEAESMAWAKKSRGSILEFHLFPADNKIPDSKLWNYTRNIAQTIYTDLTNQSALAYHVTNFTGSPNFETGSYAFRPTTTFPRCCGLRNFTLAGDWLKTSYPAQSIELAASTGREAANAILFSDNVKQVALTVSPSKGPGLL